MWQMPCVGGLDIYQEAYQYGALCLSNITYYRRFSIYQAYMDRKALIRHYYPRKKKIFTTGRGRPLFNISDFKGPFRNCL